MKAVRTLLCALVMVALVCTMMATTAFAAESGDMWLKISAGKRGGTAVTLVADTTVTNGQLELHYDSTKLTYTDVTVDERYVDVYAVNADTPGVIKIAWVAPKDCAANGDTAMVTLNFSGRAATSGFSISGSAYDTAGTPVTLTTKIEGSANTGDSIQSMMAWMLLSATAMAVCLVCNKKGWWAK